MTSLLWKRVVKIKYLSFCAHILYPLHHHPCLCVLQKEVKMGPWCSGYHYCTNSFIKAGTQVLCRFKSCSRRVRYSWWWQSLTMISAGNKAKSLSSVKYTMKTIYHQIFIIYFNMIKFFTCYSMSNYLFMGSEKSINIMTLP